MDDISDILNDVSRNNDPFAEDLYAPRSVTQSGQADLQALTRAWVNERGAAELLPWPKDGLVERITERIKTQIEEVEVMTGDMDPKTNFGLIIIQTEVERWKFLVRSFLRARIAKIDKHTLYYLSSPDLQSRLSEMEVAYATRHQQLLHSHYLGSFLNSFPKQLQNLNDTAGGISMIGGPDDDSGVFARALGSKDGGAAPVIITGRGRDGDGEIEVARGEVVVARWADVKDHVENGEMELV
ncbi:DNA replication complex GINS SLD5 [Hyphodiscus hymeniophilus]|uniref:DNA replication complex GINS protein SLD5 n=1 Tax=Hyphodiscus hymeniophilus TaxID=353542 RepID=A0A9P7AZ83_9HELO|nr:DNA replication complex GINS SLD5 [Hyphodiscus hymeniophilus]